MAEDLSDARAAPVASTPVGPLPSADALTAFAEIGAAACGLGRAGAGGGREPRRRRGGGARADPDAS